MPCFKGLAVSIHTPDGLLPEFSIQKQTKFNRITSYIPVPPAKVPTGSVSNKPEQSTFAISITLLTPGLNVPYSAPKPCPSDPYPRPKVVGGLPGYGDDRGKYTASVGPYLPLTSSPNETVAAYIYFDGRPKEEVATLLRRGEETWVNSRWVSVPESEGGGLAEREFLFREVGLEHWLNGLDLEGKDVAARIQRRKERLEKKRRKRRGQSASDDEQESAVKRPVCYSKDGVRIFARGSPSDESLFTSDSDSEDEPPMPEAAGQIKVALFRVLASGEIKRGEYSPQFDAHDDDEATEGGARNGDKGNAADVDHTTSFAKPKSLDPKTISTQTVTGIDPPDQPYAVFTFLYRGERQLQKMGILPTPAESQKTPASAKRKSAQLDFSSLKPLKQGGTVGFAGYRDRNSSSSPQFPQSIAKSAKKTDDDAMDSDADDDEELGAKLDADDEVKKEEDISLSPEEARKQGELAEGVRKIKLKRQHSAETLNATGSRAPKSPAMGSPAPATSLAAEEAPGTAAKEQTPPSLIFTNHVADVDTDALVGSPFKKQRASMQAFDFNAAVKNEPGAADIALVDASSNVHAHIMNDVLADPIAAAAAAAAGQNVGPRVEDDLGLKPDTGASTELGQEQAVKTEEVDDQL